MRDDFDRQWKWMLAIWGVVAAFVIAFWATIIYVIVHFAMKWW